MISPTLPHDVWLQVAHFVPAQTLRTLYSVNTIFFNIAMDLRYRQMSFAYLDNRMLKNLVRLKDPAVAKRVRVLHLHPGFLKESLEREGKGRSEHSLQRILRDCLVEITNHIRDPKLFIKNPELRLIRSLRRSEDIIQVMVDVLGSLSNITDYYVTWRDLPTLGAAPLPFVSTVFRASLRKLSLDISLDTVKPLLGSMSQIRSLEELHLRIHSDHHYTPEVYGAVMRNYLAPMVNRHTSSLRTLVIQPWEPMQLSPFFEAVDHLSELETLNIGIPAKSPHLGNPEGLACLLNKHSSTLKCLQLRATHYDGTGADAGHYSFDTWVRAALCKVRLSKLRSLDITTGRFPIETSVYCLRRFCKTLTSLSLTGGYRTYDDVSEILDVVTRHPSEDGLSMLRLGPVSLSPQLIDLLAEKLPRIYRLELLARELLSHALDVPTFSRSKDTPSGEKAIFHIQYVTAQLPVLAGLPHVSSC
ncbi:hypothetical protein BDQ17DRAFT_835024 [Cyathus striatus]|nr:hypothetical protein BDQ17DRAFT_835024 [Cyathus striatus]